MDSHAHFSFSGATGNPLLPVSAFSAYNFLKNYNFLSTEPQDLHLKSLRNAAISNDLTLGSPILDEGNVFSYQGAEKNCMPTKSFLTSTPLFNYSHPLHILQNEQLRSRSPSASSACPSMCNSNFRRQRGEKKPIPEEQKDDKYFERRRRNNQAAKKSRDARKIREDQIALKATLLEHENAILRAQLITLREEASSLRQMLLQKKAVELASRDSQICIN